MTQEIPLPPEQAPDPAQPSSSEGARVSPPDPDFILVGTPPPTSGSDPATVVRKTSIVEEVVAVPMSASEVRGPVVDAPPLSAAPSAAPTPPSAVPPRPDPIVPPLSGPANVPPLPTPAPASVPPPPPFDAPASPAPPAEQRKRRIWSILCHLLLLLVIPTAFLGIALTFLIWQLKGRNDRQVEDQGREALNFQINVAALTALLGISCFAAPLVPIAWLVAVIMCIIAARHASDGENYRYPWVLRIVTH